MRSHAATGRRIWFAASDLRRSGLLLNEPTIPASTFRTFDGRLLKSPTGTKRANEDRVGVRDPAPRNLPKKWGSACVPGRPGCSLNSHLLRTERLLLLRRVR
jgi:hypothetical protein